MPDHQETAKALMRRFPGWRVWHGQSTGTWWAMSPPGGPRRLVEAPTPEELADQIVAGDPGQLHNISGS